MNKMRLKFTSKLENEAFARTSVVAFLMPINPSVDEIMEIKTMVAEAVVNCMIHGYDGKEEGDIQLDVQYDENRMITIQIQDYGCGIENIDLAMQPLYTTKEHLERSGMGLTIMSTFADDFQITSTLERGTTVLIKKQLHVESEEEK